MRHVSLIKTNELHSNRGGGAVGYRVGLANGKMGNRIVKTSSDSSTAKRSSIGVSVTGPRR